MNSIKCDDISVYITCKNSDERIKKISLNDISYGKTDKNIDLLQLKNSGKIKIITEKSRQTILGFGGAFTESSASIYHNQKDKIKKEIISAYFSEKGNAYNMGRTHINSCDFSLGNYAYCDKENDTELNSFSIDRDKKMLIPFINDAIRESKTQINILASPWSPPAWMKTNGQMNNGGKLKKEFRQSWADYYCKYIRSYEKEGINIWGISVQNEPEATQTWDSCIYSGPEERDFIKYFLGPALEKK